MIVIIGLVILVAAVIAGVAGVLTNAGHSHALPAHGFAVFGYHVTGSTGTLFLYGIVVGALALLGLSVLLTGARRTSRRGRAARQGLKQSRRETAAVRNDRDELIDQRNTARAYTASDLDGSSAHGDRQGMRRLFGNRAAPHPPTAATPEPVTSQQPADVPAATSAPPSDLTESSQT
jgi:hypothetical protein